MFLLLSIFVLNDSIQKERVKEGKKLMKIELALPMQMNALSWWGFFPLNKFTLTSVGSDVILQPMKLEYIHILSLKPL